MAPTYAVQNHRLLKLATTKLYEFLYMDERLVIPKLLRPILLRSLHYGHPGRDSILATVANVWWPRLRREVVGIAQTCQNRG